jgi:hypothetical protein
MMNIYYGYLLSTLFILNVNSCLSSAPDKNQLSNQIKIYEVQAWLNLMPGGPGTFHIVGKYSISSELNPELIQLKEIIVLSNEKQIYKINPESEKSQIISEKENEFSFFSDDKLKIAEIIRDKKEFTAIFVFTYGNEIIEKTISQIELTCAY